MVLSSADDAKADEPSVNTRGFAEVGAYQDDNATTVLTPSVGASVDSPTAGWGASGRYLVDVVTTASPDIVATASPHWTEVRHAGNLALRYKPGTFGVSAFGSTSYTPDYLAIQGGGQITQDLAEKNLSLLFGYAYGHDTIGRTGTPFSVFSHSLAYHTLTAGISIIVNERVTLKLVADAILERGDQSKPYRYIPIFSPASAPQVNAGASKDDVSALRINARPLEQLPTSRNRGALGAHLAWRLDGATLRLDERVYADDWGLASSTTDGRYLVDVSDRLTLWPHVRFNVQKGVDFWQLAYTAPDAHHLPALRTGDRELSPLTTTGLGGGARIALGKPGQLDEAVLTTSLDGFWTQFSDTLYVKDRISVLATAGLEVLF